MLTLYPLIVLGKIRKMCTFGLEMDVRNEKWSLAETQCDIQRRQLFFVVTIILCDYMTGRYFKKNTSSKIRNLDNN